MRKAWATICSALLVLYFAYGSNMDLAQMSNRCERAATVSTAKLPSYRFIINSRGVATVVQDPSSVVQGLLWRISREDERSLDHHEGVTHGLYKKTFMRVALPSGKEIKALVYVATDSTPGEPRPGYMEKIVSAAEECGLPEAYIERLRPWARKPNPR